MEQIELLDRHILQQINSWHTPFLDVLMYWMTQVWFWLPMVAIVLLILWRHYGKKQMALILAFFALSVVMTDQSARFIKNKVQRYRPSHNLELQDEVHLHQNKDGSVYRGGQYGFVSSHAANSFGLVVLLMYFFAPIGKKYIWLFPLWAVVFCYTRMYLAVHYPLDILCGAALGIVCGLLALFLYKLSLQQIEKEQQENPS